MSDESPSAERERTVSATTCSLVDCSKPVQARGLCTAHYAKWRRDRPGRCRYCGGALLAGQPVKVKTHERCLEDRRVRWHTYTDRVINGYGSACTCCGETNRVFLTIDHVDGRGSEHRRSLGYGNRRLLLQIIAADFPPEYTILCYNCNCGRARNGGICPHVTVVAEQFRHEEEVVDPAWRP